MSDPKNVAELRAELAQFKYYADIELHVAPRVANYIARQGKMTGIQLREVIAAAIGATLQYANVRFAEQLRVSEHELAEALARVPGQYKVRRAEAMSQLALHGARHTDRNEPKDPAHCPYCAPDFRDAVGKRAAAARGES